LGLKNTYGLKDGFYKQPPYNIQETRNILGEIVFKFWELVPNLIQPQ